MEEKQKLSTKTLTTKSYNFAFRCTPGERAAVIMMAMREGVTNADMLRMLIREGVKRRGLGHIGLIDFEQLQKGGDHGEP